MSTVLRLLPMIAVALLAVHTDELRAQDAPVEVTVPLAPATVSSAPIPTVRIEAGNHVVLSAGEPVEEGTEVFWLKDGETIAGVSNFEYDLGIVEAGDSGVYEAQAQSTLAIRLQVFADPPSPILNCSLRGGITAEVPQVIGGIVIARGPRFATLVRAVGPSLSRFGVKKPLPDPQLHFFDAQGRPADQYILGITPAVVGAPTIEEIVEAAAAQVGAFPLPRDAGDVAYLVAFPPGAYTAHVTSASGATGEVLLEFYDVPSSPVFE